MSDPETSELLNPRLKCPILPRMGWRLSWERVRLQKLLSGRREVGDFREKECDAIERGETAFPKQSLRKQNMAESYSRTLLERTAARRSNSWLSRLRLIRKLLGGAATRSLPKCPCGSYGEFAALLCVQGIIALSRLLIRRMNLFSGRCVSKLIAPIVLSMGSVPLHPLPRNPMLLAQLVQLLPQILVQDNFASTCAFSRCFPVPRFP